MNGRRLAALLTITLAPADVGATVRQPVLGSHSVPIITLRGLRFRDLNRNGRLDAYEDWRLSPEARADDLLKRLTLREKAGTMMHGSLPGLGSALGASAEGYDIAASRTLIDDLAVTSFITRLAVPAAELARQNNAVQDIAEHGRLGIPLTISTDPRNHFQYVAGASVVGNGFSQWPELLGFAALRDPAEVRRFADVARGEYRAVGIQEALSPQADLATEPRWSRMTGTFGSNPGVARQLVEAYVAGFQGGPQGLTRNGVMTVVKHWVGYGAEPEGWDGHNRYGRIARIDDKALADHIEPFEGAFAANVAGVMPTYVILSDVTENGRKVEQVGAGFNRYLLTDLLRGRFHYQGVILSDWAITRDCDAGCRDPHEMQAPSSIAMPWGVEDLSEEDRYVKGVEAGLDQFGGVTSTDVLVKAVTKGKLSEARLTESARRILLTKFRMGLFENPFVDPDRAGRIVGAADSEGRRIQAEAQVLLQDRRSILPLKPGTKVYLEGVDATAARAHRLIPVDVPDSADVVVMRTGTPFEVLHPNHYFGSRQHEGRLDFRDGDAAYDQLKRLAGKRPVIMSIFLDRPAILSNVVDKADVILANFGASDDAVLDVVAGRTAARGRLPFELPSSMKSVDRQDPARPDDSASPLFPYGSGILAAPRTTRKAH